MAKRAIITGAAGLIGKYLTEHLLEAGWEVAAFDLKDPHTKARFIRCDLSDPAEIAAAFEHLDWPQIDLLVNNAAAISDFSRPFAQVTLEDWNQTIQTNLTATFLMSQHAAKKMIGGATIINLASTRAFMSEGGDFIYAASKGGIISLTQALAIALGPDIRVNAIAPGWISGDKDLSAKDHTQHPAGRVGRPHDIAEAVLYLHNAGFVTGETLTIDGGMTKKMIYAE